MTFSLLTGDARAVLPAMHDDLVHCVVTSPPYWGLRDYGVSGQLGQEKTPEEFVSNLTGVFREIRRILRPDGTLWLNLGDTYARGGGGQRNGGRDLSYDTKRLRNCAVPAGTKAKDIIGIPWMVAFALRADGWFLRSEIIWHKSNPMPETVYDRPSRDHEHLFLLTKSATYHYDAEAIKVACSPKTKTVKTQPIKGDGTGSTGEKMNAWMTANGGRYHPETRNARTVWAISPRAYKGAHFATFPPELPARCILAGCPSGGLVLDPFSGAGTTGLAALRLGRRYVGVELNPEYVEISRQRLIEDSPLLNREVQL